MKRWLALLLACMMVISLSTACSSDKESSVDTKPSGTESTEDAGAAEKSSVIDHGIMSANGEVPIVEETMDFDIACRQVSNVTDMDTNSFVMWLEDQTNIHINYEMIPEESISEKTNLILASGQYPDAFQYSSINTTLQVKYGAQGAFVDLAPYFEKFGYYANKAYADTTYLPKAITTPTGQIFSIAGVNECYHCFHAGRAWINQNWLDSLGLEYPNTTDELKTVLEGFRDNDVNGNGDASDEIPMLGTGYTNGAWNAYVADWLLESYIYCDYNMMIAVDPQTQTVQYQAVTDAYREGLKMIAEWVSEGLIDSEFLSLNAEEYQTLGMGEDARIGVAVAACWWSAVGQEQVTEADGTYRDRNYVALSNVEGPNGVRNTLTNAEGVGGNLVITSACEYPEVLFRWADFQMSDEASIRAYAGSYEESVAEPDAGALGINEEPALYKIIESSEDTNLEEPNENCDNVAIANKSAAIRLGQQTDWEDPEAYYESETRLYCDTRDYYVPYDAVDQAVPTMVMGEEDASKRTELETPIQDYQREWLAKFCLGNADLDADWEEYVSGFDGLRLDEYITLLNDYYQILYVES